MCMLGFVKAHEILKAFTAFVKALADTESRVVSLCSTRGRFALCLWGSQVAERRDM